MEIALEELLKTKYEVKNTKKKSYKEMEELIKNEILPITSIEFPKSLIKKYNEKFNWKVISEKELTEKFVLDNIEYLTMKEVLKNKSNKFSEEAIEYIIEIIGINKFIAYYYGNSTKYFIKYIYDISENTCIDYLTKNQLNFNSIKYLNVLKAALTKGSESIVNIILRYYKNVIPFEDIYQYAILKDPITFIENFNFTVDNLKEALKYERFAKYFNHISFNKIFNNEIFREFMDYIDLSRIREKNILKFSNDLVKEYMGKLLKNNKHIIINRCYSDPIILKYYGNILFEESYFNKVACSLSKDTWNNISEFSYNITDSFIDKYEEKIDFTFMLFNVYSDRIKLSMDIIIKYFNRFEISKLFNTLKHKYVSDEIPDMLNTMFILMYGEGLKNNG